MKPLPGAAMAGARGKMKFHLTNGVNMQQLLSITWMFIEFLFSSECRIWLRMALKPVAVFGVFCVLCWVGGKLEPHVAHAATNTLACPVGLEQNGQLCYPQCKDGFYGDGPICVKPCPTDYKDDIALCRKDAQVVAKASYGRGAGSPMTCAANQEGQGGLCYPKCAATHYGVGPVCWERCKAGYADHGATCYRGIFDWYFKNTYGRGAGVGVSACAAGMERNGSLCYPKCTAGYYGAGPVCFQFCPSDYKDDGAVCRKDAIVIPKETYPRGAGVVLNTVPEALDATFQTAKNTPVTLSFEHNDFDDDQSLPTTIVEQPSHGTYDGERYIPSQNFEGADRLLWKVNDGKNDSNVAVLTLLVGNVPANTAPVALDRTINVTEDTPLSITVTCTDAENNDLLYQLLDKPQHGVYQWAPPNTVIYTPTLNFVGADSFTFRSHDGQAFSNVSTITLKVVAVNDAPLAQAQTISTTRNSNVAITLAATDAESDPITYTVVSSPTHGLLSGQAPSLLYTPSPNFTGSDSFQFKASDPQGAATVATIHITVQPTNTAPVATALVLTTSEESAVSLNLGGSDADNDPLTYTIVTTPTHGVLTGEGADWVYTPKAGFTGVETFTFKANDGQVDSAAAPVTINVTPTPLEASVGGLVYEDLNSNGLPDGNDRGVGGLLVTLTSNNVQAAGVKTVFTTQTDEIGTWRLDNVPRGQYTLQITSSGSVKVSAPIQTRLLVDQRGVQQLQPNSVTVTSRSLFLPLAVK
ncbi:MAG: Ig-like domain-containing protein [Caldilineaceae bacterium]